MAAPYGYCADVQGGYGGVHVALKKVLKEGRERLASVAKSLGESKITEQIEPRVNIADVFAPVSMSEAEGDAVKYFPMRKIFPLDYLVYQGDIAKHDKISTEHHPAVSYLMEERRKRIDAFKGKIGGGEKAAEEAKVVRFFDNITDRAHFTESNFSAFGQPNVAGQPAMQAIRCYLRFVVRLKMLDGTCRIGDLTERPFASVSLLFPFYKQACNVACGYLKDGFGEGLKEAKAYPPELCLVREAVDLALATLYEIPAMPYTYGNLTLKAFVDELNAYTPPAGGNAGQTPTVMAGILQQIAPQIGANDETKLLPFMDRVFKAFASESSLTEALNSLKAHFVNCLAHILRVRNGTFHQARLFAEVPSTMFVEFATTLFRMNRAEDNNDRKLVMKMVEMADNERASPDSIDLLAQKLSGVNESAKESTRLKESIGAFLVRVRNHLDTKYRDTAANLKKELSELQVLFAREYNLVLLPTEFNRPIDGALVGEINVPDVE